MKVGGVLGIIGGLIALLVGAIGHSATGMLGSLAAGVGYSDGEASMQYYGVMSLALPIIGLVGAGLAFQQGTLGAALMAISAAGILFVFGAGVFSLICAILLGIGATLAFLDKGKTAA